MERPDELTRVSFRWSVERQDELTRVSFRGSVEGQDELTRVGFRWSSGFVCMYGDGVGMGVRLALKNKQ